MCGSLECVRLPAVLLLLCVTALCCFVSLTPGVWVRLPAVLLLFCVTALVMLFCVSDPRCVGQTASSTSVVVCDSTGIVVLCL